MRLIGYLGSNFDISSTFGPLTAMLFDPKKFQPGDDQTGGRLIADHRNDVVLRQMESHQRQDGRRAGDDFWAAIAVPSNRCVFFYVFFCAFPKETWLQEFKLKVLFSP